MRTGSYWLGVTAAVWGTFFAAIWILVSLFGRREDLHEFFVWAVPILYGVSFALLMLAHWSASRRRRRVWTNDRGRIRLSEVQLDADTKATMDRCRSDFPNVSENTLHKAGALLQVAKQAKRDGKEIRVVSAP